MWNRVFLLGLAALVLVSCARTDPATNPTPIGDIIGATARQVIDDSANYEGRLVKLSGEIVLECSQGCWLFLDDGTDRIYVDLKPGGITIPQMIGRQITVIGHIEGSGGNAKILGDWVGFP